MIFAEVTFCPPKNLEQPVMVLTLCPYLISYIVECATELTDFKIRIQGNILNSRFSFELINFFFYIFY